MNRSPVTCLLVVLCSVLTGLTFAQSPEERLLIASRQDGEWRLYTTDLTGDNLTSFSADSILVEYNPSEAVLSPKGDYLAFIGTNYEGSAYFYELFLLGLPELEVIKVTNTGTVENGRPRWSPNGDYLAYLSGGVNAVYSELRVFEPATGQDYLITDASIGQLATGVSMTVGAIQWFDWSPDGNQLMLNVFEPSIDDPDMIRTTAILVLMNRDGSPVEIISDRYRDVFRPVWADERSIYAICEWVYICKFDLELGNTRDIFNLQSLYAESSGDGFRVGFFDRTGDNSLILQNLNDGNVFQYDPRLEAAELIHEGLSFDGFADKVIGIIPAR